MKFCTHCGKELSDESVVCPGCGCPLNTPVMKNQPQSTKQNATAGPAQKALGIVVGILIAVISVCLVLGYFNGHFS